MFIYIRAWCFPAWSRTVIVDKKLRIFLVLTFLHVFFCFVLRDFSICSRWLASGYIGTNIFADVIVDDEL